MDQNGRTQPSDRTFTRIFLCLYATAESGDLDQRAETNQPQAGTDTSTARRRCDHREEKPKVVGGWTSTGASGRVVPDRTGAPHTGARGRFGGSDRHLAAISGYRRLRGG